MLNNKPATPDYPVLEVIANRWSPYAFSDRMIEKEKILSMLEAARWAASSYNEQPWFYIVGWQGDENFGKLAECLAEGNAWAKKVPVLMLSIAKTYFEHKHAPNRHYMHDTGMADAYLTLQATALDVGVHQMAGFEMDKARELFEIGEEFEPGAMIAIGYYGDQNSLPEELKQRELAPRKRRTVQEMLWKSDL